MSRAARILSGTRLRVVAVVALAHFVLLLALAICPELHHAIHGDSEEGEHQCAVTDFLAGGAGDDFSARQFAKIAPPPAPMRPLAAGESAPVAALFLTTGVLEHAPPTVGS